MPRAEAVGIFYKVTEEESLYRKLIYVAAAERIPFVVMCNLTYRCPLACGHCYVADPRPGGEELTPAEYESLFDQLAAEGTLFLTFSGGDPLLRSDFVDIMAAARERGFAVRIFTGGTPLDDRLTAEIAALHPIAVEISIHAATPQLHDRFVGMVGAWHKAMAGARRLTELGVNLVIKMNVANFNYFELMPVHDLAMSLGADFRYSPFISVKNDGGREPLRLRMTDEQFRDYFRTVTAWVAQPSSDGDACDEELSTPVRYNQRALSCMAGLNNCSIDPYGTVWPCVSLPYDLGNIRDKPFAEIWRGEEAERVRALSEETAEECARCELYRYCLRCPAFSLLEDGDIRKAAREYCRAARLAKEVFPRPLR
jgi:radical SAM protein with 4Fe4S-binding SPASM domain